MASSVSEIRRLSVTREAWPALRVVAHAAPLFLVVVLVVAARPIALGPTVAVVGFVILLALLHAQRATGRSLAAENRLLSATAARATLELRASRARIAASAEQERRRIERDLHDGAQQRLVALRIELELAEALIGGDPGAVMMRLRELEAAVDEALEELRALAHGVHPPLLSERGPVEALRASTARAALPVEVTARGVERYPPEVESTVYFCALEAVQNACKHATGARRVRIDLDGRRGWELRVTVTDDGAKIVPGDLRPGAGITNMHDRVEAVGGRLEVIPIPAPGHGCAVRLSIPVPLSASGRTGERA